MNDARIMSAVHCAHHLLGGKFADVVRVHAERHEEQLEKLAKAVLGGNRTKIRSAQDLILKSHASKFVCLVRSLKKRSDLTAEWVLETAAGLDAFAEPGEPVQAWAQPKSHGEGWRPVCRFGPRRKALQTLMGDILVTKFGVDPIDYLAKGRGPDIASDRIISLVEAGFSHFLLADIKNCFRSVQHERLKDVTGLPEKVITACLLIGPDAPVRSLSLPSNLSHSAFDGAVRQGLPQGSRSSNLVMSLLLGPALRSITSADRLIILADDMAVAAHDEEEARAFETALSGALEHHPAGPFRFKRQEVVNIHDGFDFLKYSHRRDPFTGNVKLTPARKSYDRFYRRFIGTVQSEPVREAVRKVGAHRRYWMRSFPRWQQTPDAKFFMQLEMEHLVRVQTPGKWAKFLRGRHPAGWK